MLATPFSNPFSHPATHERLVRFFGVRLRMVVLIVAVGLGGGAIGAAYMRTLELVIDVLGPGEGGAWTHLVVLAVVGTAITMLVRLLGRPADVELLVGNIHVAGTTDAGAPRSHDGRLRSLIPVSLLSVGTGGTLGPEAPLVTTTGTLATRAGIRYGVSPSDVRTLAITGMAAGFSVLFGAPLGAAIFALEIPHRRGLEYYEALVPAAIGAVCGYAVSTAFGGLGLEPIWNFPVVDHIDGVDLGWALLAGVLGAAIGVLFTVLVGVLHRGADAIPAWARPTVGGVTLGWLAVVTPYALTNGEFQIESLLDSPPAVRILVVAGIAKLLGAAIVLVTGWRGGFIIPLFFTGFVLGWAVAGWLPIEHEWVFVAGTMVAANVAVTKTPFGSALVVTEMAGFTLLPTTLVSSLTCLVLTSPVGLIDNQRRRFDAYEPAGEAS
ncbi:MAG: chloride channel protein [Ilumatobacteraceae bacterium]